MSRLFDFFAQHVVGILVLVALLFALILIIRWLCWIFCWGRFARERPSQRAELRFVITDFFVKLIDDFRHLLALVIVFIFLAALMTMLWPGLKERNVYEMEDALKVVAATLGNLMAAVIGYYFGESAGVKAARLAQQIPSATDQAPEMPPLAGPAGVVRAPEPPGKPDAGKPDAGKPGAAQPDAGDNPGGVK